MSIVKILSLRQIILTIVLTMILLVAGVSLLLLPITESSYFASQVTCEMPRHFSDLYYPLDDETTLSFPVGGFLVPILQGNNTIGLAIYGEGQITEGEQLQPTQECFLLLPEEEYYTLMSQLYLQTSTETFFQHRTIENLPEILNLTPFIVTPAGNKYFPLPKDYRAIVQITNNTEIRELKLIGADSLQSLKSTSFIINTVGYIMLYLALIGLILVLTNKQHKALRATTRYILKPSVGTFRWHLLILNLAWIALLFFSKNIWLNAALLSLSLGYSLYYLLVKKEIYPGHLRITVNKFTQYFPLAILCGVLFFFFGAMTIPSSILPITTWLSPVVCNIWLPIIWICFIIFGYLLYDLERSILLKHALRMILALIIIAFFALTYVQSIPIYIALLNSLVFIPLIYVIMTLLVLRTDNLFTAAVSLMLSFSLASIFGF